MTRTGTTALTLSEEIRQRFDEFSRSQKDVGQYIVDHLEEAAFHTAEELARRANTSSSTVVRFAQALGFEGSVEHDLKREAAGRSVGAADAERVGAAGRGRDILQHGALTGAGGRRRGDCCVRRIA